MTLLFDENLSPRLVGRLADLYPSSAHVRDVGLAGRSDAEVWALAARDGYVIVSKDGDFVQRALLFGPPPRVVWLQIGNGPAGAAERLLRDEAGTLRAFGADPASALLRLPL